MFLVAVLVKTVQTGLALGRGPYRFVELCEQFEVQHFLSKVGTIELRAEYGLVQQLQLLHGELLRKKVEANGAEVYALTQHRGVAAQNVVVVEGQLRHLIEGEPPCLGGIVAPPSPRLSCTAHSRQWLLHAREGRGRGR